MKNFVFLIQNWKHEFKVDSNYPAYYIIDLFWAAEQRPKTENGQAHAEAIP